MKDHRPSAERPHDGQPNEQGSAGQRALDDVQSVAAALWGKIFNRWTVGSGLVLMLVLLLLAWLSGMPSGELRLAALPAVTGDPDKIQLATRLFQRVDAAVSDAEDYHRQLSFAVGDRAYDVSVPLPAAPGENGLGKFVQDLSVGASIERDVTKVSGQFDVLAILEKTYEWLGRYDYFVVIREIVPADCPGDAEGNCWRVVAQYWPSLMRPDELVGTEDELARDLAVLVLRGAVRNQGDEWRRTAPAEAAPPFLLAAATPVTMAALEATARGLEILTLGPSHPDCQSKTEAECIDLARSAFRFSIEREKTLSPLAAYGLALIELDDALRAGGKLASDLAVEAHLSNAEAWTSRALQSEFLRSAMSRTDLGSSFKLLDLHGLAPGETLIDLARRFACALADYRRANWQGCVSEIGEIHDFPPPLQPYVEAALIDASLTEAADRDSFGSQLETLEKRLASFEDAEHLFMLRRVVLKHACERQDILDDDSFAALVRATTDNAPHQTARHEAMIQAAACRPTASFPSEADLEPIVASIEAMPESKERHRFELLLSQYRIRRGELDMALDLAKSALPLPWTGPYVRKAPAFAAMIASPDHGRVFIEASFSTTALSQLESCHRLE